MVRTTDRIRLTDLEKKRLRWLIRFERTVKEPDQRFLTVLEEKLNLAETVGAADKDPTCATINSCVQVRDVATGYRSKIVLVFPCEMASRPNHVSVLTPVGAALLGVYAGEMVEFVSPSGTHRLEIEDVAPE